MCRTGMDGTPNHSVVRQQYAIKNRVYKNQKREWNKNVNRAGEEKINKSVQRPYVNRPRANHREEGGEVGRDKTLNNYLSVVITTYSSSM